MFRSGSRREARSCGRPRRHRRRSAPAGAALRAPRRLTSALIDRLVQAARDRVCQSQFARHFRRSSMGSSSNDGLGWSQSSSIAAGWCREPIGHRLLPTAGEARLLASAWLCRDAAATLLTLGRCGVLNRTGAEGERQGMAGLRWRSTAPAARGLGHTRNCCYCMLLLVIRQHRLFQTVAVHCARATVGESGMGEMAGRSLERAELAMLCGPLQNVPKGSPTPRRPSSAPLQSQQLPRCTRLSSQERWAYSAGTSGATCPAASPSQLLLLAAAVCSDTGLRSSLADCNEGKPLASSGGQAGLRTALRPTGLVLMCRCWG